MMSQSPEAAQNNAPGDPIATGTEHRSLLVDRVSDILMVLTTHGDVLDANFAAVAFTGMTSIDKLIGRHVTDALPDVDLDLRPPEDAPPTFSRRVTEVETRRADGETRYLNINVSWSDDRSLVFLVAEDASSQIRRLADMTLRMAALTEMAFTDVLTQLPNRLAYEDRLTQRDEERDGGWLVMFDVDDFKMINDSMGHPGGDLLLRQLAERLRRAVRKNDFLARIGGDEFALFLPARPGQNEIHGRLRYLQTQLAPRYEFEGTTFRSSCSFGAVWCGAWMTTAEWVRQADAALYESKANGKASVTVFRKQEIDPRLMADAG